MKKIKCPCCKGKGSVWDLIGICCMTIIAPFAMLVERDDDDGCTRNPCPRCDGQKYIEVEWED